MPITEMKGEQHSPLPTQSAFIAFQNAIVLLLMLWQVLQVFFFFLQQDQTTGRKALLTLQCPKDYFYCS